jgi:cytochrome c oxidase cbb3-type subunit 2
VGLVAAIYVHFLIFAQFGFLQGIRSAGYATEAIHRVLGAMALAGIAASIATALALHRRDARTTGAIGFALAAAAGGLSGLAFASPAVPLGLLVVIAILTGAGLGASTVSAAILLRRFTGGRALALQVGAGTGLAYLVCNIPAVFTASPAGKGWISAAAALAGLGFVFAGQAVAAVSPSGPYAGLVSRRVVAMATLGFLALVWFDSAAFTAVQNSADLRALFWSGPRTLWTIGLTHALAALAAGLLIDRGALRAVLAAAFVLLAAGHLGFGGSGGSIWAAPAYAAGVSLYSTALAAFAALGPADTGMRPAWRATWVYALAGWVGSGAGVGLAEQFGRVPLWAAPSAAVVLAVALFQLQPTR